MHWELLEHLTIDTECSSRNSLTNILIARRAQYKAGSDIADDLLKACDGVCRIDWDKCCASFDHRKHCNNSSVLHDYSYDLVEQMTYLVFS